MGKADPISAHAGIRRSFAGMIDLIHYKYGNRKQTRKNKREYDNIVNEILLMQKNILNYIGNEE